MRNYCLPRSKVWLALPLLLTVVLAGAAPSESTAAAKVVGPPDVAWKDMSEDQKATYMKKVVTPKMKVVFQGFDKVKFRTFNCASCHGKDPKGSKFKMPSADLPPLPGTPEAFGAKLKTEPTWPKWAKFMSEEVTPKMADFLGMPHFDPKKPVEGAFSCAGCHTLEKPKP